MTQQHLKSLTYEIKSTLEHNNNFETNTEDTNFEINTEDSLIDDNKVIESDGNTVIENEMIQDETASSSITDTVENALKKHKKKQNKIKNETTERDTDCDRNFIRKVEMILDYETEIHIYEDKFKIVVKKQAPFYISKKTWKLMLQRHITINTASTLTEITGSSLSLDQV
jgi:hypothetical protein